MKSVFNRFKGLDEALLLEYNRADLKKWAGEDLTNKFLSIRSKMQPPENDLSYWIKKGDLEEFERVVNGWESGDIKSNTQAKKEEKVSGADLIKSDNNWKVYFVKNYSAAKYLGSGTTWCITGRYHGAEERGKHYFDNYIKDYKLNGGYYFIFDLNNKDPQTGDYQKYCAGVGTDGKLKFLYNGMQDIEISRLGIPNIPEDAQVELIPGIEIGFRNLFTIQDGVLVKADNDLQRYEVITIPEGVEVIDKNVFKGFTQVHRYILPSTLREIKNGAFLNSGNSLLEQVNFNDGLEKIGVGAFFGNSLTNIEIPDSVTEIGSKAFYYNTLETVKMSSNISKIGEEAFEDNSPNLVVTNCNEYARTELSAQGIKCGEVTEELEIPLEEAKSKNVEALASELDNLKSQYEDLGPNGFYSMSFSEFEKQFPEFTNTCLKSFLLDMELATAEELSDEKETNEMWQQGELIQPEDWACLFDGAERLTTFRKDKGIQWEKIYKKYSDISDFN